MSRRGHRGGGSRHYGGGGGPPLRRSIAAFPVPELIPHEPAPELEEADMSRFFNTAQQRFDGETPPRFDDDEPDEPCELCGLSFDECRCDDVTTFGRDPDELL